jgi:hypothetical protein
LGTSDISSLTQLYDISSTTLVFVQNNQSVCFGNDRTEEAIPTISDEKKDNHLSSSPSSTFFQHHRNRERSLAKEIASWPSTRLKVKAVIWLKEEVQDSEHEVSGLVKLEPMFAAIHSSVVVVVTFAAEGNTILFFLLSSAMGLVG